MELKTYIKIVKKYIILIIIISVLGGFIAVVLTSNIRKGIRTENNFLISAFGENYQQGYQYDGFYAQEKAKNFTDNAVAIIESPQFINELMSQEGLIAVRKIGPQIIRISVTSQNRETASLILESIESNFNKKIKHLYGDKQAFIISPVGQHVVIDQNVFDRKIIFVFGALIGSLFAILSVGLKIYLKI
ncbi:hypothetical protein A3F02_00130 [Candidatus Curtissbacteria bacterium RIFCSPHIGHO2_12_FULL_38_9b]|uniref:Polysaccharide chain length determinant N-terminal domain-containing protein n=2 Tax=Candidatus Curtissiibacteriota TaxID=1752717 RepID=A0A1F5GXA6_9BACT|nr:MAG: hypothetical protein A3A48_03080 [Candidatus Curtissbacteria bacterium RIFCSPLOWO2_01_FULL_37_9]OGD96478.1 MAG: hypothetical protein A3F02_00130 [Candidatus Curtissbacteria bacterium RIFCSPHIGHO2_12_FULL_38_9b]